MITDGGPVDADRLLGGRYRLGTRIGRGGVADVYTAVDVVLGRDVAVKLFRSAADAMAQFRFATEARLLAAMSHPALVTVYDVRLDADRPYLVMQLVEGPTLRQLLEPGPLPPAAVAWLGAQLADALAHVHEHDVVHRDVKPSNVLVDSSGTCYLADFGLARALSAAHLTASGQFVGTAAYLAPEQVTDIDTGPPADVYALGLVLLECLTGKPAYPGTEVESAIARLSRQPRIPDNLAPAWRAVLTAMTARSAANRPDARRCAELLRAVTGDTAALPTVPADRPLTLSARPRRRRLTYAGLTALAVTAAVAAGTAAISPISTSIPGQPTSNTQPAQGATSETQVAQTTEPTPSTNPPSTDPPPPADVGKPADAPAEQPPAAGSPTASPPAGNPGKGKSTEAEDRRSGQGKDPGRG